MKRREFIGVIGGAAAWPLAAHAQQAPVPVIGYLDVRGPDESEEFHRGFRQGLKETGFVEGENLQIIYRYAGNEVDRLPELAADLVRRQVALIFTSGGFPPTMAAKQATASIPGVFTIAENPVARGLVASLARPGGNLTGVNFLSGELTAKRLELQRELVPKITRVALLINPHGSGHEVTVRDVQVAAQAMGLQTAVYQASSSREIDAAFDAIVRERADALFVANDPLFTARRVQLVHLASRHGIPGSYGNRLFTMVGGLMAYGSDITDATRQSAIYAGRILKGAKPEELPVLQSAKVELIINMQTARTLGISVPTSLQVDLGGLQHG